MRELLSMSAQGAALILALLVLRALFGRRVPPTLLYALWLLPAVRLLVPGSVASAFSLANLVLGRMDLHFLTYYNPNGNSAILGPVAAGVVSGAVYGCAIRHGGATGGTDVVAAWVRRKRPEAAPDHRRSPLPGEQFRPLRRKDIGKKEKIRKDKREI